MNVFDFIDFIWAWFTDKENRRCYFCNGPNRWAWEDGTFITVYDYTSENHKKKSCCKKCYKSGTYLNYILVQRDWT